MFGLFWFFFDLNWVGLVSPLPALRHADSSWSYTLPSETEKLLKLTEKEWLHPTLKKEGVNHYFKKRQVGAFVITDSQKEGMDYVLCVQVAPKTGKDASLVDVNHARVELQKLQGTQVCFAANRSRVYIHLEQLIGDCVASSMTYFNFPMFLPAEPAKKQRRRTIASALGNIFGSKVRRVYATVCLPVNYISFLVSWFRLSCVFFHTHIVMLIMSFKLMEFFDVTRGRPSRKRLTKRPPKRSRRRQTNRQRKTQKRPRRCLKRPPPSPRTSPPFPQTTTTVWQRYGSHISLHTAVTAQQSLGTCSHIFLCIP